MAEPTPMPERSGKISGAVEAFQRLGCPSPPHADRSRDGMVISESIAKRFWAKVRVGSMFECWLFTGATSTAAGYGSFAVAGHGWLAHRLAHYLATGELPEVVMHSCDNPPCCNPAHLSSGTYRDNARDSWRKGRQSLRGRKLREVGGTCGRGHLLAGSNLYQQRGRIECRLCRRMAGAKHDAKRKQYRTPDGRIWRREEPPR